MTGLAYTGAGVGGLGSHACLTALALRPLHGNLASVIASLQGQRAAGWDHPWRCAM